LHDGPRLLLSELVGLGFIKPLDEGDQGFQWKYHVNVVSYGKKLPSYWLVESHIDQNGLQMMQ